MRWNPKNKGSRKSLMTMLHPKGGAAATADLRRPLNDFMKRELQYFPHLIR